MENDGCAHGPSFEAQLARWLPKLGYLKQPKPQAVGTSCRQQSTMIHLGSKPNWTHLDPLASLTTVSRAQQMSSLPNHHWVVGCILYIRVLPRLPQQAWQITIRTVDVRSNGTFKWLCMIGMLTMYVHMHRYHSLLHNMHIYIYVYTSGL